MGKSIFDGRESFGSIWGPLRLFIMRCSIGIEVLKNMGTMGNEMMIEVNQTKEFTKLTLTGGKSRMACTLSFNGLIPSLLTV